MFVDPKSEANMQSPAISLNKRQGRYAGANLRQPAPSSSSPPSSSIPTTKTVIPAKSTPRRPPPRRYTPVPDSLQNDPELASNCRSLPSNYSFELAKTIHRAREANATRIALQLPEGLLLYATTISDIIRRHVPSVKSSVILGDVTYGACCIDDLSASALSADLLVHYGHSCLVPVSSTVIPTLYVFVHIAFDISHLLKAMCANFKRDDNISIVGTIQFVDAVHRLKDEACPTHFDHLTVPQKKPLSPGELLGCTSPQINNENNSIHTVLYIGDGRFHLESAMIANPEMNFFRYDPYSKKITRESYATSAMHEARKSAIATARKATNFGVVLGTLGRQGSPAIMKRLISALRESGREFFVLLLSEMSPAKLKRFELSGVQAWVQVACPRLSIDWGDMYSGVPLLTPYECFVALGKAEWREIYPMDYYAKDGGEWTNYYKEKKTTKTTKPTTVTA